MQVSTDEAVDEGLIVKRSDVTIPELALTNK
jgi:hypothetical protein